MTQSDMEKLKEEFIRKFTHDYNLGDDPIEAEVRVSDDDPDDMWKWISEKLAEAEARGYQRALVQLKLILADSARRGYEISDLRKIDN